MQATGEEKYISSLIHQWNLHSIILICQARQTHWCNNGMKLTNEFLIGFKTCSQQGILAWYSKPDLMIQEVIDPDGNKAIAKELLMVTGKESRCFQGYTP